MNDDVPTPKWLMQHFEGWFDPCPLGGTGGLEIEWKDRTYVNPPYSKPHPWIQKAIEEANKGKRIVLLVRVDTSTKWWMSLIEAGWKCAFFHGRVKFIGSGTPNFCVCLWFSPGAIE